MSPPWLTDLLLNLLSEAVGIVVTVFIVDRLFKRREEKRWAPSKHLLQARLFKLADDIIYVILGISEGHKIWGKLRMYYFGEASVMSYCDVEGVDSGYIIKTIEANLNSSQVLGFNFNPFIEAQRKVSSILDTSAFLIDPEAIELLLQLDEELQSLLKLQNNIEYIPISATSVLLNTIEKAIAIRAYFEKRANKIQNISDHLDKRGNAFK